MDQTIGKRLREARLTKKLEIEEASDATKIRPERIVDLERDEYSHFPNLAYAKSFLVKYARFLGVDVHDELDNFQVNRSISLGEYQYLSSDVPKYALDTRRPVTPKAFKVPPWILVVLVLIVLIGVPSVGIWTFNVSRLGKTDLGSTDSSQIATNTTPAPSATPLVLQPPGPISTPSSAIVENTHPADTPSAEHVSPDSNSADLATAASPSPVVHAQSAEVRRALPVIPGHEFDPLPSPTPEPERKLEVHAHQQTWIQVIRDNENSTPVFDGFTGPDNRPIVVEGKRFWLRVMNREAIDVFENGQPVQASSGDVVIN
jgi:cytoskeletal protein RodZ